MAAYNLDPYAAYSHVQGRRYCASVSPVSHIPLGCVRPFRLINVFPHHVVSGVHGTTQGMGVTENLFRSTGEHLTSAFPVSHQEFEAILKAIMATQSAAAPAQVQAKRGMDEVE